MSDLTKDVRDFIINDEGKDIKFLTVKLDVDNQLDLIREIIRIVAKGSITNEQAVKQLMHNLFQTGVKIDDVNKETEIAGITLILDAVKGALVELDRDTMELLKNKLMVGLQIDLGNNKIIAATKEELNKRLSGWRPLLQILRNLIRINLGFL